MEPCAADADLRTCAAQVGGLRISCLCYCSDIPFAAARVECANSLTYLRRFDSSGRPVGFVTNESESVYFVSDGTASCAPLDSETASAASGAPGTP